MSKKTNLLLFLTLMLGVFSFLGATIWTVGPTGDYTTIQAAISAVTTFDGDVIQIDAGTYSEALSLGKSLTLIGSGPASNPTTILTSTASPIVQLTVTGKSFTFQNLIIEGVTTNLGIRAGSSISIQDLNLLDVIARNCKVAVYLSENDATTHVNNLLFDNVILTNNTHIGAYIGRSVVNGIVTNSTFSNNGYSDLDATAWQKCGIQFIDFYGAIMPRVQVTNSTFINNGVGASSIERTGLVLYTAANTLSANELMTVSGCTFTDHPLYAVRIRNGYNVGNQATVNGTFTNNYLDIWFSNMDGYTSSTTNVRRSFAGIRTVGAGPTFDYSTIQAAMTAAVDGDLILVDDGTYTGNIVVNKNITLKSVNGAAVTIIDGNNAGGELGAIQLTSGRNGVVIGGIGQGFHVKGIDGTAGLEKAAIYLQGTQTNITIEGNIIEARGDAGLMGEYNAANNYIVINANEITGKTFLGDNPAGVSFTAQYTLLNVPRQLVVFGGGSGTTNTQNFTFTNNIISGISGGMSITDNSGNPIAPTPQGNTMVTLDLAGTNVISGNTFSGATTASAEAIRMRGAGLYTLSGNTFNGSYPNIATAGTSNPAIGIARINDLYNTSTISGKNVTVLSGGVIAVPAIFTSVNNAIAAASAGMEVKASIGTFSENVNINKSIVLRGSGIGTIIEGIMGVSGGNTITIATSNVTVDNLSVTRAGNNVSDWNAALNNQGIIINQGTTGAVISNCYIYGNRNAVYLNNTQNNTIINNVIDNNRTGIQLVNNVSGVQVTHNDITNNWTMGILLYYSGGTVASTNTVVNYNNISGNWYSQVECKFVGTNPTTSYDFLYNWFGLPEPVITTELAGEPGYAAQIPVVYGGTSINPEGNEGKLTGQEVSKLLVDPWYADEDMEILGSFAPIQNVSQNTFYNTIQEAINAALPGETIAIDGGTYVEQLHITTNNLTIQGINRNPVIIKSPAVLPLSYTTAAVNKPVVFVDGVSNFTLKNVTVDGDRKGNANYRFQGIGFWNAGGLIEDVDVINVMDNPFSGAQHGVGIYAYNNTPAVNYNIALNRVNVYDFQKNALALNGNEATQNLAVYLDYVMVTGAGPTNVTAQNGIQVSDATGTIDNCSVSNIYWTGAQWTASGYLVQYTDGLVLTNNTATNCQTAVYAYDNTDLELQGNIISGNTKYGILDYYGVGSIINGNQISDALYGLYSYLSENAVITGNTFDENDYALILRGTGLTVSSNSFGDNAVQVYNLGDPMDMEALAAANNWPGGYFIADQIIYSSAVELLYVDAPKELIKDAELQTYSVKALHIEDLRGFTVQIAIPRADFAAPDIYADFMLGSAYAGYSGFLMPVVFDDTDPLNYLYTVSGTFAGGFAGITGNDLELFTVQLTSLVDRDNVSIPGCWINLPINAVELRNAQNPYSVIPCFDTFGKYIIIDATEPTMVQNNAVTYPSGMTLSVLPDGSGDIDRPVMNLTFSDNYNLDDAIYMILPAGDTAPTSISQFSLEIFLNFDGATNTINWQLPEYVNSLADGTYTVYYLVVDDAGNFMIYDWDFVIDITPPNPIVWIYARITPDEDESVDLKMAWGEPTVPAGSYASAWVYDYDLSGGAYPEYNPFGFTPTIPAPPNPYISADQNGWHRIYYGPFVENYTWDSAKRSYFYFTVFAQDASGNYSAAPANPFYRESLSYWPGDVVTATDPTTTSVVTGADIAALSAVWGFNAANPAWNPIIDVGPSVGYYRTGRPTPDDVINIEDLMMFAMNWKNTNYLYYGRNSVTGTKPMPIGIELVTSSEGDLVRVDFVLSNNNGQLKGLNIPVLYGSGLVLQSVQSGSIWSESSLLLYTNESNILEFSVCELGGENFVSENGIIATAYFSVIGSETGFAMQRMIARNIDNSDIGILNNPSAPTEIEDIIVPVPQNYVLGNNYPNPFNPNTTISFGMKEAGYVKVTVFNSRGQVVRTLVAAKKDAGYNQVVWNGRDDKNHALASGMYFYRMEANGFAETKKALLMK
jgi:parallel beta-helix repeat protein